MGAPTLAEAFRMVADAIESGTMPAASAAPVPAARVLDCEGAAAYLSARGLTMSPKTVQRSARSGRLPAARDRYSSRWRFAPEDLDNAIELQRGGR